MPRNALKRKELSSVSHDLGCAYSQKQYDQNTSKLGAFPYGTNIEQARFSEALEVQSFFEF